MIQEHDQNGKSMITVEIWQNTLRLQTDSRLFSPRQADAGTLAMLGLINLKITDRVLDLGCGYGLVGLAAAKILGPGQVVMVDIDPLAVRLSRQNAILNGFPDIRIIEGDGPAPAKTIAGGKFSLILCNPPYHSDFSVAKRMIEQSCRMLDNGGRLYLVVKRLAWYRNKMAAVFGGVQVQELDGYYVLFSEKKSRPSGTPSKNANAGSMPRKHLKRLLSAASRRSDKKPNGKLAKAKPDQQEKASQS